MLSMRDGRQKFAEKQKFVFRSGKPLISHEMDEGIFGNVWRKRPQIWKSLAWACKGLEGPGPGGGDSAGSRAHPLPIAWVTRADQTETASRLVVGVLGDVAHLQRAARRLLHQAGRRAR
jgi:hypothetical protein